MPYLAWSEDLDTKIPEIDAQHRVMIDHINQVVRAAAQPDDTRDATAVGNALQELIDCVQEHFRFEEKLLEMIEFPTREEHQGSHRDVIAWLEERRDTLVNAEAADSRSIAEGLAQWLVEHIRHDDLDFGPMVREWMQDAAPPDDPFRKLIGGG
jgi:hemerythrin